MVIFYDPNHDIVRVLLQRRHLCFQKADIDLKDSAEFQNM